MLMIILVGASRAATTVFQMGCLRMTKLFHFWHPLAIQGLNDVHMATPLLPSLDKYSYDIHKYLECYCTMDAGSSRGLSDHYNSPCRASTHGELYRGTETSLSERSHGQQQKSHNRTSRGRYPSLVQRGPTRLDCCRHANAQQYNKTHGTQPLFIRVISSSSRIV